MKTLKLSYDPARVCIYCGDTVSQLTREHIIPLCMGGTVELPAASCLKHAKLTSQIELKVARECYGTHRAFEGVKTRRKKEREELLAKTVQVEGIDLMGQSVSAHIANRDIPRLPISMHLTPPIFLQAHDEESKLTLHCNTHDPKQLEELRKKLRWEKISVHSPAIDPSAFIRVLAKIGHAAACAEYGFGKFESVLIPTILNEETLLQKYVGGFSPEEMQTTNALELHEIEHNGRTLIVAHVSLRFFKKLTKYEVICGFNPM
jgi:hypothetical protein